MIQPSWSPYAANFFFIKKKDGKLHPVQDYCPVNKWTKKNHNVSPLIPSVIDQLAGCTLFTKFNIWWGYNTITYGSNPGMNGKQPSKHLRDFSSQP
jgi:hypothetical protein